MSLPIPTSNFIMRLNIDMGYRDVYTVGCFDHFHEGHKILLQRLKQHGDRLIVGVHDDDSIERLKKISSFEHDDVYHRVRNVKQYADIVYIIPDTDPTECLKAIVPKDSTKINSCYIRGDDMPNFPGREFIESKMDIKLLPYTKGVSATKLREREHHMVQMAGYSDIFTVVVILLMIMLLAAIIKHLV